MISQLKAAGINFLAVDFDMTLIDRHTEGRWSGTASELLRHVRPEMRQLLRDALDAQMFVAIVTLSPQTSLIREVTRLLFPKDFQLIIIRGNDGNWFYGGQGSSRGKQPHIASAVEELSHAHAAQISRRSTLLIDDDAQNINDALVNGVNAILYAPHDASCLQRGVAALGEA